MYKYRWKPADRNTRRFKSRVVRNYAFLNVKAAQIVEIFEFKNLWKYSKGNIHEREILLLSKDQKKKWNLSF